MQLTELIESLIGKSEEEARNIALFNGYTPRVRVRDGKGLIGTADFKMNRVNFIIENDKVTEVKFG